MKDRLPGKPNQQLKHIIYFVKRLFYLCEPAPYKAFCKGRMIVLRASTAKKRGKKANFINFSVKTFKNVAQSFRPTISNSWSIVLAKVLSFGISDSIA